MPDGVAIIGRGNLGRSLTGALRAVAIPVANVSLRDPDGLGAALAASDLVLLAVPDEAIPASAAALADRDDLAGHAVVHLSGASTLDALDALATRSVAVGSWHPIQPFASERSPEAFRDIVVGVATDDPALHARLCTLARQLGAVPLDVPDEHRALYHAAGHQVGAFLVALAAQAQAMLGALGWQRDDALRALLPLVRGVVDNLEALGVPDALTGPFRRGDATTVAAHLEAIDARDELEQVAASYRVLAVTALELARGTGLDAASAQRLADLLAARR